MELETIHVLYTLRVNIPTHGSDPDEPILINLSVSNEYEWTDQVWFDLIEINTSQIAGEPWRWNLKTDRNDASVNLFWGAQHFNIPGMFRNIQ